MNDDDNILYAFTGTGFAAAAYFMWRGTTRHSDVAVGTLSESNPLSYMDIAISAVAVLFVATVIFLVIRRLPHIWTIDTSLRAARADLAAKLGVAEKSIVVKMETVESETWGDSCLGLAREGEECLQGPVKGIRVRMQVAGNEYVYRVDESGANRRLEPPVVL